MMEMKDVIEEEWNKPDKKTNLHNRLTKLYPLSSSDLSVWATPSVIDAAFQRLSCHVTLPLESSVTFNDPMDRRVDSYLKKIYSAAGFSCCPVLALTSVSKALKALVSNVEMT